MASLRKKLFQVTDMTIGVSLWFDTNANDWLIWEDQKTYLNIGVKGENILNSSISTHVYVRGLHKAARMAKRLLRVLPRNARVVILYRGYDYWYSKSDIPYLHKLGK